MALETMANLIENPINKQVLDMGTGTGKLPYLLTKLGASRVVGVDICCEIIEYAKQNNNHENIEYKCSDIFDCNFSEEFDVIVSAQCIHKVEDFVKFIQLAHEWLVPGGEFVLSIVNPLTWSASKTYFEEGPHEHNRLGHIITSHHRTLETYVTTLLKTGFIIESLKEIPHGSKPTSEYIIFKLRK